MMIFVSELYVVAGEKEKTERVQGTEREGRRRTTSGRDGKIEDGSRGETYHGC